MENRLKSVKAGLSSDQFSFLFPLHFFPFFISLPPSSLSLFLSLRLIPRHSFSLFSRILFYRGPISNHTGHKLAGHYLIKAWLCNLYIYAAAFICEILFIGLNVYRLEKPMSLLFFSLFFLFLSLSILYHCLNFRLLTFPSVIQLGTLSQPGARIFETNLRANENNFRKSLITHDLDFFR